MVKKEKMKCPFFNSDQNKPGLLDERFAQKEKRILNCACIPSRDGTDK